MLFHFFASLLLGNAPLPVTGPEAGHFSRLGRLRFLVRLLPILGGIQETDHSALNAMILNQLDLHLQAVGFQLRLGSVVGNGPQSAEDQAAEGVVFLDGEVDMQRFGHMGQGGAAQNAPSA